MDCLQFLKGLSFCEYFSILFVKGLNL